MPRPMTNRWTYVIHDDPVILENLDDEQFPDGFLRYHVYASSSPFTVVLGKDFDGTNPRASYPDADCTCNQPAKRREMGLKIVRSTCTHLGLVLDALHKRRADRQIAYRLKSAFRAGRMRLDEVLEALRHRADAGDFEARQMHDEIRFDEKRRENRQKTEQLFPIGKDVTVDLAEELFG